MPSETPEITPALEDYLEAIYVLQKVNDVVKVADIAGFLKVTMPSVTGGMHKLSAKNLIEYKKRRYVQLTGEGERLARAVHRKHEELFHFFHHILEVDKGIAEEDACKAEHILNRETVNKLIQFTQRMTSLPPESSCGASGGKTAFFKTADEEIPQSARTLTDARMGECVRISKMRAKGELKKRLTEMGLTKGCEVEVVRAAPLGDPIDILVRGYHLSLRKSEAAKIEVEK